MEVPPNPAVALDCRGALAQTAQSEDDDDGAKKEVISKRRNKLIKKNTVLFHKTVPRGKNTLPKTQP